MNKKKITMIIALFFISGFCLFPASTKAAEKYINGGGTDKAYKINGKTFISKQYRVGNDYRQKIIMKKNGKTKTLVKNVTGSFNTNGKIMYYVARGKTLQQDSYSYHTTMYRLNLSSGKKSKVLSGIDLTILGCNGKFLYCGRDYGADGVNLYSYNLKTKKKIHMRNGVGFIYLKKSRVISGDNSGDACSPGTICSFKLNGKNKIKIVYGGITKVTNSKIYYYVVQERTWKFKIYSCTFFGKNKKAHTGWINNIPKKYRDY